MTPAPRNLYRNYSGKALRSQLRMSDMLDRQLRDCLANAIHGLASGFITK